MAKMAQAVKKGMKIRSFTYSKKKSHPYHWTYVLIAKDPKQREMIARGMERAVRSKKVKYSNKAEHNADLYDAVKKKGFDCMRLKKVVTTNCCNATSVACRYAGIKTPRKNSAASLPTKWKKYGFKVVKYKKVKNKLKRGYILDASNKPRVHTAVYLG